jgi:hypothetical protein
MNIKKDEEATKIIAKITIDDGESMYYAMICGCRIRKMFFWIPEWHFHLCPYNA